MSSRRRDREAAASRRDSGQPHHVTIIKAERPPPPTPSIPGHRLTVKKFLLNGRYIDQAGHTLHNVAGYYDDHAKEYENRVKDNQGDSRDINAAFRVFVETPGAEEVRKSCGNKAMMVAFEEWWRRGGFKAVTGKVVNDEEQNKSVDFRDKVRIG